LDYWPPLYFFMMASISSLYFAMAAFNFSTVSGATFFENHQHDFFCAKGDTPVGAMSQGNTYFFIETLLGKNERTIWRWVT